MSPDQTSRSLRVAESSLYEAQINALAQEYNLLPREKEVLHWLGSGLSNADIAFALDLSENTVRCRYMNDIFRKMNCQSRAEVIGVVLERMTKQCEAFLASLERVKTMRGESFNNIEMEIHHTLAKSGITPNLVQI